MTKQRHCVTKLRLFNFFRCLAAICLLKLCVLGMLLLDMPLSDNARQANVDDFSGSGGGKQTINLNTSGTGVADKSNPAEMRFFTSAMRADGEFYGRITDADPIVNSSGISTADSANALLVAGQVAGSDISTQDESLLDMLGLTRLPVPALGVRIAAAAALDLPAPATSQAASSPFAPAEQNAPLSMPGSPPIPANIPRGQSVSGTPLAPRAGQVAMPPLPSASNAPPVPQLTPNVLPQTMPDDPNAKAQELARQQQDILMLRRQMDDRLKDIENAEQKMQDMIREAKGLEDKKIRHLIQMYANMKPKVAAKAIESLDERVAARILSGMAAKQSGEVLTYTAPEKTAKLTELLTRMRLPEE